ncbi:hypothetical protein OH77DRAFT_1426340 [Trametes cingulata]|nr:hypothetical protein OH77DRAFT_1426340 [Trametes cingulata]
MGSSRSALPIHIAHHGHPGTSAHSPRTSGSSAQSRPRRSAHAQTASMSRTPARQPQPHRFSEFSDPAVPDSVWFTSDFMLGSGMVVLQPSTGKVVVLREKFKDSRGRDRLYYFLPKGRKDVGESLEQAALREAYEESGYRVSFFPLIMPTHAPSPPNSPDRSRYLPCSEPIYVNLQRWQKKRGDNGGEYLTFWYVGQIPEDAVVETGTRMPDEVGYETFLVTHEQAMHLLAGTFMAQIVDTAYDLWRRTHALLQDPEYLAYLQTINVDPASLAICPAPPPVHEGSYAVVEDIAEGSTAAQLGGAGGNTQWTSAL